MPAYMLDTDTVSFALRGQGRVATRLLEHRPSELCISSITLAELRFGAEARRSRRLHRLISTFVETVEVGGRRGGRRDRGHRGRAGGHRKPPPAGRDGWRGRARTGAVKRVVP